MKNLTDSAPCTFIKTVPETGHFALRPFREERDAAYIHDWVNRNYARYWQMQGTSLEEVKAAYRKIRGDGHTGVYTGFFNEEPRFLLETYKPVKTLLKDHYPARGTDRGMHILVAPAESPLPSFTWHVFTTILDFIFSDKTVERVVVEPDVRNDKIHRLNRKAGFVYEKEIALPGKNAFLAFCTRDRYAAALNEVQP